VVLGNWGTTGGARPFQGQLSRGCRTALSTKRTSSRGGWRGAIRRRGDCPVRWRSGCGWPTSWLPG
jgi:hypothetical protein